jgi:hypothetical protein
MRHSFLIYFFTLTSCTLLGQSKDTWISFWSKDTSLIGFKDKNGLVKIEPKFSGFTSASKFDDIIAVTEAKNETWNSYYLTKTGELLGKTAYTYLTMEQTAKVKVIFVFVTAKLTK